MRKAFVAALALLYCSPIQAVPLDPPSYATDLHLVLARKPGTIDYIDIPGVRIGKFLELRQHNPDVWQVSILTFDRHVFQGPFELGGLEEGKGPWGGATDKRDMIVSAYWTKLGPDGKDMEAGSVPELEPKMDVLGNMKSFLFLRAPEPESWTLMVMGFAAIGLALRKRPRDLHPVDRVTGS